MDYFSIRELNISLDNQEIKVITKPGLPEWDQVTPSHRLIAEKIKLESNLNILIMGCGHGASAVSLARHLSFGNICLWDTNIIALRMAEKTLEANQINNATIYKGFSVLPDYAEAFDVVTIDLPKGRKLARRMLCEAFSALVIGGKLYLSGANREGIQAVIKDMEALFGSATILAYKKGNRLAVSEKVTTKPGTAKWAEQAGISPGTWYEFMIETPYGPINLSSLPGVFSYDRLDEGTRLLLPHITISPEDRVLDLGCGYGILGICAAIGGAQTVEMVDVNLLAVAAAMENLEKHDLKNAKSYPDDVLGSRPESSLDKIISNPPFHAGRQVDYQMAHALIAQSFRALKPGGSITLVANRFIRYDHEMERFFSNVNCIFENPRYHILRAIK